MYVHATITIVQLVMSWSESIERPFYKKGLIRDIETEASNLFLVHEPEHKTETVV